MKRWLTYLIPLMVVSLFWNCKDNLISEISGEDASGYAVCETICSSSISASETEYCLPRQISYTSPSRIQTSERRTTGYNRVNVEFTRSGELINAGLRYSVQTKSILIHYSLIEPALKLLYLGKLII